MAVEYPTKKGIADETGNLERRFLSRLHETVSIAAACSWSKRTKRNGGRMLNGKKVIAIGERDGVPGPVIAECLEGAGFEVVFQVTECFV